MKRKVLSGITAVTASAILSGCCGYQGHCVYEERVPLSKANERITAQKVNVQLDKNTFKAGTEVEYTFDQITRIDTKDSYVYTEGSGAQVTANLIGYPVMLIFSPLRLMSMKDEVKKEFGREYVYTSGKQASNMFNPFACTFGDLKEESEVTSSKEEKETLKRTELTPVTSGIVTLVCDGKKTDFPVTVTSKAIYKSAFGAPLPVTKKNVKIVFQGKEYPFELTSADMAKAGDVKKWNEVVACKDADAVLKGTALADLESLGKKGLVRKDAYAAESKRLNDLIEQIKFPAKEISDSRIKFADGLESGTSFRIAKDVFKNTYNASNVEASMYVPGSVLQPKFDGVEYQFNSSKEAMPEFIFACTSPGNKDSAVLVMKIQSMPEGITIDQVTDKLLKDNPSAKVKKYVQKYSNKATRYCNYGQYYAVYNCTAEGKTIETDTAVWRVFNISSVTNYEADRTIRTTEELVDGEKYTSHVFVYTFDKKLLEHFVAERKTAELEKANKAKAAEDAKKQSALDSL